jgi:hypothetical protein
MEQGYDSENKLPTDVTTNTVSTYLFFNLKVKSWGLKSVKQILSTDVTIHIFILKTNRKYNISVKELFTQIWHFLCHSTCQVKNHI